MSSYNGRVSFSQTSPPPPSSPPSSIHGVFLQNPLYLGHIGVMLFCMQFKKVGRGLLREAKRREGEWALLSKAKGDENNFFYV